MPKAVNVISKKRSSSKSGPVVSTSGGTLTPDQVRAGMELVYTKISGNQAAMRAFFKSPATYFAKHGADLPKGTEISVTTAFKFGLPNGIIAKICVHYCCQEIKGMRCPKPPCFDICFPIELKTAGF
jgi:hypothetical protein